MNAPEIAQSTDDLAVSYETLRCAIAELLLVPEQGAERDAAKEIIRIELGNVARHLGCVRDALQYSLADELEASKRPECS
jgi:hypothetical protein